MSREDTVSPSGDSMKGVGCIPLLSTYCVPVEYPSTVQTNIVSFPEQLKVNVDVLFSNVV